LNPGFANPLGEPRFAAVAVGSARRQESKKLVRRKNPVECNWPNRTP